MAWPRDDAKLDRVRALDGRARARRDRRPRARQRPLPDELLGDEGLRRGRLPARGRADALLPRGVGRRCRADGVDDRRPARRRVRRRPIRVRRRRGRSTLAAAAGARARHGRARALARARRPRTAWSASRRRTRRAGSTRSRTPSTRRRCSTRPRASRRRRRSSACGSRTRSPPPRWITCSGVIRPGMTEAQIAAEWLGFVHGEGTGWGGEGRARARLLARLVGARDQDVHRDDEPAGGRGRADALRDLGLRRRLLVPTTRRTSSSAS